MQILSWTFPTTRRDIRGTTSEEIEAEGRRLVHESPVLFAGAAWSAYQQSGRGVLMVSLPGIQTAKGQLPIVYMARHGFAEYFAGLPMTEAWCDVIDTYEPELEYPLLVVGFGNEARCRLDTVRAVPPPRVASEQCAASLTALGKVPFEMLVGGR